MHGRPKCLGGGKHPGVVSRAAQRGPVTGGGDRGGPRLLGGR